MPDFPSTPAYNRVETRKRFNNVSSRSRNYRRQVRSFGASIREYTLHWPPITRANFATIFAFVDGKEGMLGTFTIYVPDPSSSTAFDFSTGDGCIEITARFTSDVIETEIGIDNHYRYSVDIEEVLT